MKLNKPPFAYIAAMATTAAFVPCMAFASLGGNISSSIPADRMQMKASLPVVSQRAHFTMHEMTSSSGTRVREYADATGNVFGVTWKGPAVPDLRQLMGSYFDTYTNAAKIKHSGHSHLSVKQEGLVVRTSGHMRAFYGTAFIPTMLPQGVSESDIQ